MLETDRKIQTEREFDVRRRQAPPDCGLSQRKATRAFEENALNSISRLGLGSSDLAVLELLLHKGAQLANVIGQIQ
jgi:hypothetical protein